MPRRKMTAAAAARYKAGLARALEAGHAVLVRNGTAVDAVCAAVVALEDSPLFNAGRGACYNTDEKHELDASVMDGATLRAGAVAAVSRIRNPVLASSPNSVVYVRGRRRRPVTGRSCAAASSNARISASV